MRDEATPKLAWNDRAGCSIRVLILEQRVLEVRGLFRFRIVPYLWGFVWGRSTGKQPKRNAPKSHFLGAITAWSLV
jgi:hypothetical protein